MSQIKKNYVHVVEINEGTRILQIFRLYCDGSRVLYTETELPKKTFDEDAEGIRGFARVLGENLLADSSVARKLLKI